MKHLFTIIYTLLILACSQKPASTKQYFRLNAPAPAIEVKDKEPGLLWVKRPQAQGILGNRPFVVTNSDGALQQLSYHHWLDSPQVLLQTIIAQHAQQHWQKITTRKPAGFAHHELSTQITAFEKNGDNAVVTLFFTFYNVKTEQIHQQQFTNIQSFSIDEGYAGFVDAINTATLNILSQLEWHP